MIGFINIDKPEGVSSAYVVNKIKKKLNTPCGHMGTLDPLATGVLPVAMGKATRLFDYLLDKEKVYTAVFEFGYETDTLDKTGTIINSDGKIPAEEEIKSVLGGLTGIVEQIPPKYSAKCVNGQRGYDLARRGVDFTLKPKKVEIRDIKLISFDGKSVKLTITCGGGTYIRSICRDLAYALGTYATMTYLRREKSGSFCIEDSVTLDEFLQNEDPSQYLIATDTAVNYEKIYINSQQYKKLLDGVFDKYALEDGLYRVYAENSFIGIGLVCQGVLKIKSYCR